MLMACPPCCFRCASTFDLSPCVVSQFDRDACQQSVCAWRPAASLEGQQTFTGELVVTLSCSWGLARYSYVFVLCMTLTFHLYCCSIWPHVCERPDGHCTKVTKIWNGFLARSACIMLYSSSATGAIACAFSATGV